MSLSQRSDVGPAGAGVTLPPSEDTEACPRAVSVSAQGMLSVLFSSYKS